MKEKIIKHLEDIIQVCERKIQEFDNKANYLCDLLLKIRGMKGNKWVSVKKVKLIKGSVYIIRRVYGTCSKRYESPLIAKWTERGWEPLAGYFLDSTTISSASIEVWR